MNRSVERERQQLLKKKQREDRGGNQNAQAVNRGWALPLSVGGVSAGTACCAPTEMDRVDGEIVRRRSHGRRDESERVS